MEVLGQDVALSFSERNHGGCQKQHYYWNDFNDGRYSESQIINQMSAVKLFFKVVLSYVGTRRDTHARAHVT